jgi:hypothetical protein
MQDTLSQKKDCDKNKGYSYYEDQWVPDSSRYVRVDRHMTKPLRQINEGAGKVRKNLIAPTLFKSGPCE